jgi:drug/metabolite transporter (DMT)-like permease
MEKINLKGIIFILLSSLFFGSYGIWSKLMGENFGNYFQGWFRALVVILSLLPILIYRKELKKIAKSDHKWFGIVAFGAILSVGPYFYAFNYLNIGTATLLFYASLTICSFITGYVVFKEEIGIIKLISLILAIGGLSYLFKFEINSNQVIPALGAIASGVGGGIEVTMTKKISDKYPANFIVLIVFLAIMVFYFALSKITNEPHMAFSFNINYLGAFLCALSSLFGFFFAVKGFQYLEASIGSIIGLTEIIFAVVFGIIFFHEILSLNTMIGCVLIMGSAALPNIKKSTMSN